MEAIILAGGFGTRLKPLTYTRAKSLLPILNKPMISYIIRSLPAEVDKVILAVNYRKNQIENYFKENDFGIDIIVNEEPKPLGTGGAVKFAEKHLTDYFFVLNSDIISSINLDNMIKFHKDNKSLSTISLWKVDKVSEFGVADVLDNGKIVGFVEKPKPEDAPSNFINAGAYLIESEVLDYIESHKFVSMEKEIFPKIINDTNRFYGYKFKGFWMDIGRINSYLHVNKFLLKKENRKNIVGKNVYQNGVINYSSIGDNVIIGENTIIDSSIVFDNVKIGNNVKITNSILGEKCVVEDNSNISNSVIGDKERLEIGLILDNKFVWNKKIPKNYPKKQIGNVIEK